jgi:hypothetical protein
LVLGIGRIKRESLKEEEEEEDEETSEHDVSNRLPQRRRVIESHEVAEISRRTLRMIARWGHGGDMAAHGVVVKTACETLHSFMYV